MNQNVTVVIMAAGLGTRMRSGKAKVLHQAGGDTLLNHVIRAAARIAPPEHIVAVIGHQAERVRESVNLPGVRFAIQHEQRGTGHAVSCARAEAESPSGSLVVLNGDGPLVRAETLASLIELRLRQSAAASIVTTELEDPTGYGRIIRDSSGMLSEVIEQKAATPEQLRIREVNPGLYCFDAALFWRHIDEITPNNPAGEYYLTDMIGILTRHGYRIAPLLVPDYTECLGINTRVELAVADAILRRRKAQQLMLAGVTIENPDSVSIDADVEAGEDSVLEANVQLRGNTILGANCRIGTGSVLRNCRLADNVTVLPYVVAESSSIAEGAVVGPFARLRMNAAIGERAHVGNFVELKKTSLGTESKANHLAYLGDASIGAGVNIGAGTITCNYDGRSKHPTTIGDGAFVGSNSTLVAPIEIGAGAYVAAGSAITKDAAPDSLVIGRAYQVEKPGWARRRREAAGKDSNSVQNST
jgi:bifunctional UDP-N-acetylglucosamine pyrophosphorylase/glucosamine-1-phosphate N-acetyltransferase